MAIKGNATLEDQKLAASVIGPGETLVGAWRISEEALSGIMAQRVTCDPKNGKCGCCDTCMWCVPLCWPCAIRDFLNQFNENNRMGLSPALYVYRSQLYLMTDVKFYVHVDTAKLDAMAFHDWWDSVTSSFIYPRSVSVPLAHIGNPAYPLKYLQLPSETFYRINADNQSGMEATMPNPASLDELMPRKAHTKLYGPLHGDISPSSSISGMHFAVPCGTLMRSDELKTAFQDIMTSRSKELAIKENRWDLSAALAGGFYNDTTAPPGQEWTQTVDADLSHYHSTVADLVLGPAMSYRRPHFLMWLWFEDSQFDEALQLITDNARAAGAGPGAQAPKQDAMTE